MNLNEGLRKHDLKGLVSSDLKIDMFQSKMGEDQDVCVVNFFVKDRDPAKDLMEFLEKGYEFVLDADVSSGEISSGGYNVFVEVQRNKNLSENLLDMLSGVSLLSDTKDWNFTYHKNQNKVVATKENIEQIIPNSSEKYSEKMLQVQTEEYKNFFNKTLMDDLVLEGDKIKIVKPFGIEVTLEQSSNLSENLGPSLDSDAMAEVFWLTKVLGDYNIQKVGEGFVFTNQDKQLFLKRSS